MKHLDTYVRESMQINEFRLLRFGPIIKIFKRMFMPWTEEAIRFYKKQAHKIFVEELTESKGCPKEVWKETRDDVNVVLYNYRPAKNEARRVLDSILNYKEHPNIVKFNTEPTADNTGYVLNIYVNDPAQGLWGIFMPGQNGKLTCLINYIKKSDETSQINKLISSDLKKIMNKCLSFMK